MTDAQNTETGNDVLLAAGRIMTVLLMAVTLIVASIFIILVPITLVSPEWLFEGYKTSGAVTAAAVAMWLIAAVACLIVFYFFKMLREMIESVSEGNPFCIANADRLSKMGWIALAFQLASFPIGGLVTYLGQLIPNDDWSVDFEFSLTGVLLAVVLFILARVFRQGAAMRDDLEGTV